MTRRAYIEKLLTLFLTVILWACGKKNISPSEDNKQPIKILGFTNEFPDKIYAGGFLMVTWKSENINTLTIYSKIGSQDWEKLAFNINPGLNSFQVEFPIIFSEEGSYILALEGDGVICYSPEMQKWNTLIVDANIHTELLRIGSIKQFTLSHQDVFIKRKNASEITCFSSLCTHAGCPISFLQNTDSFNCSCHGSQFDNNGNVINGPAEHPLSRLQTETLGQNLFRVLY